MCDEAAIVSDAKERLNVLIFETLMDAKGVKGIAALSRLTEAQGERVSRSTIFRLKAGEVGGSLRVAKSLARALDTTVETLFAPERREP